MRVRFVVPILLALSVFLPGAASGAACAPLDCGPTALSVADGKLLAFGLGKGKPTSVYDLSTGELRDVISAAAASPQTR